MEIFKNLDGREKCLGLHLWESWNLSAFVVAMQSLSRVWLLATPWTAAYQASLCFSVSWSLLKFMSIESVILSNCLILCGPFSSCPQSLPASGSFPVSRLFASGGQSFGTWASALVLPVNSQGWFPSGLTDLISLHSKGLSRVFSNSTVQKQQFLSAQLSLESNSHICTWLMLKLKFKYFGHLLGRTDSLRKTFILGKIEGKRKRRRQRMR